MAARRPKLLLTLAALLAPTSPALIVSSIRARRATSATMLDRGRDAGDTLRNILSGFSFPAAPTGMWGSPPFGEASDAQNRATNQAHKIFEVQAEVERLTRAAAEQQVRVSHLMDDAAGAERLAAEALAFAVTTKKEAERLAAEAAAEFDRFTSEAATTARRIADDAERIAAEKKLASEESVRTAEEARMERERMSEQAQSLRKLVTEEAHMQAQDADNGQGLGYAPPPSPMEAYYAMSSEEAARQELLTRLEHAKQGSPNAPPAMAPTGQPTAAAVELARQAMLSKDDLPAWAVDLETTPVAEPPVNVPVASPSFPTPSAEQAAKQAWLSILEGPKWGKPEKVQRTESPTAVAPVPTPSEAVAASAAQPIMAPAPLPPPPLPPPAQAPAAEAEAKEAWLSKREAPAWGTAANPVAPPVAAAPIAEPVPPPSQPAGAEAAAKQAWLSKREDPKWGNTAAASSLSSALPVSLAPVDSPVSPLAAPHASPPAAPPMADPIVPSAALSMQTAQTVAEKREAAKQAWMSILSADEAAASPPVAESAAQPIMAPAPLPPPPLPPPAQAPAAEAEAKEAWLSKREAPAWGTAANPVAPPVAAAPVPEPVPVSAAPPVAMPVAQPVAMPVAQPMAQPMAQPVAQPVYQPVAEAVYQPVTQPVAHVADSSSEVLGEEAAKQTWISQRTREARPDWGKAGPLGLGFNPAPVAPSVSASSAATGPDEHERPMVSSWKATVQKRAAKSAAERAERRREDALEHQATTWQQPQTPVEREEAEAWAAEAAAQAASARVEATLLRAELASATAALQELWDEMEERLFMAVQAKLKSMEEAANPPKNAEERRERRQNMMHQRQADERMKVFHARTQAAHHQLAAVRVELETIEASMRGAGLEEMERQQRDELHTRIAGIKAELMTIASTADADADAGALPGVADVSYRVAPLLHQQAMAGV